MTKFAMKTPLSSTTFLRPRCQQRAHTGDRRCFSSTPGQETNRDGDGVVTLPVRPAVKKIAMTTPLSDNRFLPQDTGFKHWSCFCPPQTPAKKLAMVPSLQPAFLKMPMAPTFLSSSNTRRHNNARPPPFTLSSARRMSKAHMDNLPKLVGCDSFWGGLLENAICQRRCVHQGIDSGGRIPGYLCWNVNSFTGGPSDASVKLSDMPRQWQILLLHLPCLRMMV